MVPPTENQHVGGEVLMHGTVSSRNDGGDELSVSLPSRPYCFKPGQMSYFLRSGIKTVSVGCVRWGYIQETAKLIGSCREGDHGLLS